MSKTAVLDRDSAAPSLPAPTADRVRATESPFPAILNGLLQQNRHECEVLACPLCRRSWGMSGRSADIGESTRLTQHGHAANRYSIASSARVSSESGIAR